MKRERKAIYVGTAVFEEFRRQAKEDNRKYEAFMEQLLKKNKKK